MGASTIKRYLVLIKPLQTFLLLFSMYGAYFAAAGRGASLRDALLLGVGGLLAVGGTTATNMYVELDIDALMPRTAGRPLPRGELSPLSVLAFSLSTYLAGLLVVRLINPWVAFAVMMGFLFDIVLYTDLAKRRHKLNIVLGGVAGGMPAFGGWIAYSGRPCLAAALMSVVVMAWIPMHIWFIATYYLEDYRRAGIPMLPVVVGPRRAAKYIALSLGLQVASVAMLYAVGAAGPFTLAVSVILGSLAVWRVAAFHRDPSRQQAFRLFKIASPYLAAIFLTMALERVVGIV